MKVVQKTAIVTGASSGLGRAVAELLSKEHLTVFALARGIEQTTLPDSVVKVACNVRDLQSIDNAFAQIDRQTTSYD